jgi:predicted nicotinamide N-methyase
MLLPMDDLVDETIELGTHELRVRRPRDPEALLDTEAFQHEEFLPYWPVVWPSGVQLARYVATQDLDGARVLEIGCGLALPSFAAALRGAHVLATDWSPDAIEFARANAERNGIELEFAVASWSKPRQLRELGPFDLVLASDVLYERRHVPLLIYLLPDLGPELLLTNPERPTGSELLLADPKRTAEADFLAGAADRGWAIETSTLSEEPTVRLHRVSLHP